MRGMDDGGEQVQRPRARSRPAIGDILATGIRGLRARPLRASLAVLGIGIGIATVVLVTSIPASSQAALEERLTALGADLLRVDPVQTSEEPATLPESSLGMLGRVGPVTGTAVAANLHEEVRRTAFRPTGDGALTALAVDGPLLDVVRGSIAEGSAPRDGTPTVVLGTDAARRLGIERLPDEPVTIDIGGVAFQVTGILEPTPLAPDLQTTVMVGWEAAERWLDFDGRPTVAYVTAVEDAIEEVRPVLAATLSPQSPGSVQVSRPSAVLAAKETSRTTSEGLFVALAAVSLAVGGIGIANTMFASVLERRRDIGLRRALGARRSDIAAQFLVEALALCSIGGILGVAVGAASSAVWAIAHEWPVVVPAAVIAGGVGAALLMGAIAGLAPSVRAARLDPTSALALG